MDKSTHYKIFTDPVHGFISVPKGIVLNLLDHAYIQRLRRIRQLGLSYLVFPGAEHSRFSHALGALGLMVKVLNNLKEKDATITNKEYESTLAAILLHDIGHGPFSHTLEHNLIRDFNHEMMTTALMHKLNKEFDGKLKTAISIFSGNYPKQFLHQLVSSQLDIDRLDYLKRDSIYTGVSEGSIGVDRIIKTMRVHQGHIVIDEKGIYAVENYITARRLMYMQVYLHKTALSADKLLRAIFRRVSHLIDRGDDPGFASSSLKYFLVNRPSASKGISDELLRNYVMIDDSDVHLCIKLWLNSEDPILSDLCQRFLNRKFFRTTFFRNKPGAKLIEKHKEQTSQQLKKSGLPHDEDAVSYYLFHDYNYSEAYKYQNDGIWIMDKYNDTAVEFSRAAETKNIIALTEPVVKHYGVHLKELDFRKDSTSRLIS